MSQFYFDNTDLQEPQSTEFQDWLAGISDLSRTNLPCESDPDAENAVYVDGAFAGTATGGTAAPYPSVSQAISNAAPGSVIRLNQGSYAESLALDNLSDIRIEGGWVNNNGTWDQETENPSAPTLIIADSGPAVMVSNASGIELSGLDLQGGLAAQNADDLSVSDCRITGPGPTTIADSTGVSLGRCELISLSLDGTPQNGLVVSNSQVDLSDNLIHAQAIGVVYENNSSGTLSGNAVYVRSRDPLIAVSLVSPLGTVRLENNVLFTEGAAECRAISETGTGASPNALLDNQFYGDGDLIVYADGNGAGELTDVAALNNGTLSDITEKDGNSYHPHEYSDCAESDGVPCADITHVPMPPGPDNDGDGLPDDWEEAYFDDTAKSDGTGDADEDGLSTAEEYVLSTDPVRLDSDGDGVPDGWEDDHGTDPNRADGEKDRNDDGVSNLREYEDAVAVYVDGGAGGGGTGAANAPFNQISQAIAHTGPYGVIRIAVGSYHNPVNLQDGIRLRGGWTHVNGAWTLPDPMDSGLTVIESAIQVDGLNDVALSGLTLQEGLSVQNSVNFLLDQCLVTGQPPVHIAGSRLVRITQSEIIPHPQADWGSLGLRIENAIVDLEGNLIQGGAAGVQYGADSFGLIRGNSVYVRAMDEAVSGTAVSLASPDIWMENNVLYLEGAGELIAIGEANSDATPYALINNRFHGHTGLIMFRHANGAGDIFDVDALNDGTLADLAEGRENRYIHQPYSSCLEETGAPCADITFVPRAGDIDTDGDGLDDEWEDFYFGGIEVTDGTLDSDGDGLDDDTEHIVGTDPTKEDTDGDGLPDEWERQNNTDPFVNDAWQDKDGDGTINLDEWEAEQSIYVDGAHEGTNNGTPSHPYQTIARALDNVAPGQTIRIAAGDYAESLTISQSDIRLRGGWENDDGVWSRSVNSDLRDPEGDPVQTRIIGQNGPAVSVDSATDLVLESLTLEGGLDVWNAEKLQLLRSLCCGVEPVYIVDSRCVFIRHSHILGIAVDGTPTYGLTAANSELDLERNFIQADIDALTLRADSSARVWENSLYVRSMVSDNTGSGVCLESPLGPVRLENNVIYVEGLGELLGIREVNGTQATPTMLVDNDFFGDENLILYRDQNGQGDIRELADLNEGGGLDDILEKRYNRREVKEFESCFESFWDTEEPCADLTYIPFPMTDMDMDGLPDQWEITYFDRITEYDDLDADHDRDGLPIGLEYKHGTDPTQMDTDQDALADGLEVEKGSDPLDPEDGPSMRERFTAGVFIVGPEGLVQMDWLYDGGQYTGEMGIFSLSGMEGLVPGSPEFIQEAVRRVRSDSKQGYVVIADIEEGARIREALSDKEGDYNDGDYKGLKSFEMTPDDPIATILIPNGSFAEFAENPDIRDEKKRPLFSLATANPDDGMYYGQIAAVGARDKDPDLLSAFVYEDLASDESDGDYNDIIVQIKGVTIYSPTLDGLIQEGYMDPECDWREDENPVIPHLDVKAPGPASLWIAIILKSPADLLVYDPQGRGIGKDIGTIPGASFEWLENGHQRVTLPAPESGDYRIVLRAIGDGGECDLEVRGYKGDMLLTAQEKPLKIAPHQVLNTTLDLAAFMDGGEVDFEAPSVKTCCGQSLEYDFDGDGDVDESDIKRVVNLWGKCEGDQGYDPFYDLDDDGCIGLSDVSKVSNGFETCACQ